MPNQRVTRKGVSCSTKTCRRVSRSWVATTHRCACDRITCPLYEPSWSYPPRLRPETCVLRSQHQQKCDNNENDVTMFFQGLSLKSRRTASTLLVPSNCGCELRKTCATECYVCAPAKRPPFLGAITRMSQVTELNAFSLPVDTMTVTMTHSDEVTNGSQKPGPTDVSAGVTTPHKKNSQVSVPCSDSAQRVLREIRPNSKRSPRWHAWVPG